MLSVPLLQLKQSGRSDLTFATCLDLFLMSHVSTLLPTHAQYAPQIFCSEALPLFAVRQYALSLKVSTFLKFMSVCMGGVGVDELEFVWCVCIYMLSAVHFEPFLT